MPRDIKDRSRRRDSSNSSDSAYSQKSSKKRHKSDYRRKSKSKEKSSYRKSRRSTSRSKKRSKKSDSRSPIRYYSSKKKSASKDRSTRRRVSRSSSNDRSYDRSKSRSRDRSEHHSRKYKSSRSSRHKSSKSSYSSRKRSSSRSASPYTNEGPSQYELSKKYIVDDTESKIEKAIKAAEAVGLTMCKLPSYEYKDISIKEDMPTIQDRNVLDELNNDAFSQKQFSSSRNKKIPENIVIDLDTGTRKIPLVEIPKVESLFHPDLFPDEKLRKKKWIKKLFQFRQKALRAEI